MSPKEAWASGDAYERYVGRWSRPVASRFIDWLSVRGRARWLDVGCGTGALTQTIRAHAEPREVIGIDPSPDFIDHARRSIIDDLVRFRVGNAMSLPFEDGSFDAVVCGLVLNFIPNQPQALVEMYRVASAGAIVGAYVWDYAGRMELMRYFWDAAVALDPQARALDEGVRFPRCTAAGLEGAFRAAGFSDIATRAIDVPTVFRDFDDYWSPFLGGQGPAPGYTMSLSEVSRDALRDLIRSRLPFRSDGSIELTARAWAVRGLRS